MYKALMTHFIMNTASRLGSRSQQQQQQQQQKKEL
jgi:hypothetical protein